MPWTRKEIATKTQRHQEETNLELLSTGNKTKRIKPRNHENAGGQA
jgi:hypothetical protein